MPEAWERILPSWKVVPTSKAEEPPQIFLTRSKEPKKSCDRISLNKSAVKKLGIRNSAKCHILIQKKSRQAAIKILTDKNEIDVDCFCLSLNKNNASIRRANLFDMMDIEPSILSDLEKYTYRTELIAKDGLFIFKLPDKTAYQSNIPDPKDFAEDHKKNYQFDIPDPEESVEDHKVDIDFAEELFKGL